MRKMEKESILQLLETLCAAQQEIKKQIEKKAILTAQDLLAQCQDAAISIGNRIEASEGETCKVISYLEGYCELLYQVHGDLSRQLMGQSPVPESDVFKKLKELKEKQTQIENSVRQDIPVRREVVFLPYKASMWDSLESVYLAAKEDPNCDAYCIPIPYFDRNPDHSLGQMHYEGADYPDNIEITDWKTYDLETRRPDAIYIHNPYDEYNYVTCVHPHFFSKNLKKYTEELVYIPYFVLGEIDPHDQTAIDDMKHFIWTPGVIFADKVILQSKNMRQIYLNEYLKAAKKSGYTGSHVDRKSLRKKFLGLGSPKFDKVQSTKKEHLEIPESWRQIIEKPNGDRKKIVLYNTSVSALLKYRKKMIEKMKLVLQTFYENRDNVVLLWRPHPLIEATIKSMCPELWMEYKELREQYIQDGWGIYDDSTELDRAIVLSDAYYGDWSSLVSLYQKTEKPIMIQAVEERGCLDV